MLKNLQSIGGVIKQKSMVPILEDFLFELKNNKLTITASDMETTMISTLDTDMSEGEGAFAVPSKIILDLLRALPDIPVTFIIDVDTQSIDIMAGEGNYHVACHRGDDYPEMPTFESTDRIVLSSDTLNNAISKTLFATSNEELRPSITGVLFDVNVDKLIFVATDAHKLVKYTKHNINADSATKFVVPKKPLSQLKNILTEEEDVTIEYNKVNVNFSFGNYRVFSRLINSPYPDYDLIIPKENNNVMIVDKNMLINALKRIGIFVSQSTNQVRVDLSGGLLTISGEDMDLSNKAEERLICEYDGDDMQIGFNSRFLLETLMHIDSQNIRVELSNPSRAAIILPEEDEETDENLFMLVSPTMLNN